MPSSRAMPTFFSIERPSRATLRPLAMAASASCWMRCTWLAKQATMMRRPRCAMKILPQRLADAALAAGVARQLGVGRVGEQQPDALAGGDLADAGEVGPPPVDRRQVELEVAAVEHDALRGVEGEGEAARHRVGDGDELDLEGADLAPLAVARRRRAAPSGRGPASSRRLRAKPRVSARAVDRARRRRASSRRAPRRGPRGRG